MASRRASLKSLRESLQLRAFGGVGRSLRAARAQCQFAVGHAYGTLLRDVHLGLHRHRRPAIAGEHHGRSLGSKSDDDRQESQWVTVGHGGQIASMGPKAWCPRFASVFWMLTWGKEDSGRPTEYFQLTISGRPFRFRFPPLR